MISIHMRAWLFAAFFTSMEIALHPSVQNSYKKDDVDVTKNFVYITMPNGTHQLVLEPALKNAAKALDYAYATPGTKQLRRLMPRQLTGFITKKLGEKEFEESYEKTAKKIAQFFEDLGFTWNEEQKSWKPKDAQTGTIMHGFGIEPSEWVVPAEGFKSYNDFFIKQLKKNSRPIAQGDNVFVSPADSKLSIVENLSNKPGKSSFFNT